MLQSKYVINSYEQSQYAAISVTILKHQLGVGVKSSTGNVYAVVMCEYSGNYYFSLYYQEAAGAQLDESRILSKHFYHRGRYRYVFKEKSNNDRKII